MGRRLRIGTRGSELALWQAERVKRALEGELGVGCELVVVQTEGDQNRTRPLYEIGGSGFFTKALQASLLEGKVDLVVHSLKDLPIEEPAGLTLAAVCFREDPSELLIARPDAFDDRPFFLKPEAVLGTSSLRRRSQVLAIRDDLKIQPVRGNVPTRIRKLQNGEYDALLLAFAGVHRLGLELTDLTVRKLPLELMLPAPAQGALGIETRADDRQTLELVSQLHEPEVAEEVRAERQVLLGLGGGCHIPLGTYCQKENGHYRLRAVLGHLREDLSLKGLVKAEARSLVTDEAVSAVLKQLEGGLS